VHHEVPVVPLQNSDCDLVALLALLDDGLALLPVVGQRGRLDLVDLELRVLDEAHPLNADRFRLQDDLFVFEVEGHVLLLLDRVQSARGTVKREFVVWSIDVKK
jgi:hypothetical protein